MHLRDKLQSKRYARPTRLGKFAATCGKNIRAEIADLDVTGKFCRDQFLLRQCADDVF
jgi:hypothetical protein